MYNLLILLVGVCLLFISLKITHTFFSKIKNKPRASRYRRPVFLKKETVKTLGPYVERCKTTESKEVCPPPTTCRHLDKNLDIYENDELLVKLPKNKSPTEGYCLSSNANFKCNKFTGDPILSRLNNSLKYICRCKYPHLVNKENLFGDCQKIVACQPGGQLTPITAAINFDPMKDGRCECPTHLESDHNSAIGPFCKKRKRTHDGTLVPCLNGTVDSEGQCVCPEGFLNVSRNQPADTVHSKFRENLKDFEICVKNPCMWNAFEPTEFFRTNKQDGNQCVCDPLTSVAITARQSILTGEKNACISPSPSNLRSSREIRYTCCFYTTRHLPICKLHYLQDRSSTDALNLNNLNSTYEVTEEWKNSLFNTIMQRVDSTNYGRMKCDQDTDWDHQSGPDRHVMANRDLHIKNDFQIGHCDKTFNQYCDKSYEGLSKGFFPSKPTGYSIPGWLYPLCKYQGIDEDLKGKVIIGPRFSRHTKINCLSIENIGEILEYMQSGRSGRIPQPKIHIFGDTSRDRYIPPEM